MADPKDAVEFLRESEDAESENRNKALVALKFRYGDQWPQYAIASRGVDRPKLTINETNTYIKKVCNMQRQQRPRGKASPVDGLASQEVAKIITGIGRHVELNSDADNAYDTAFDFAAGIGFGYWRLRHDYIDEKSFDQDIFIDVIDNPFSVYFDRNSKLPDGSDAERTLITDTMTKKLFKQMHPRAICGGFESRGAGDNIGWETNEDIRVAEYFSIIRKPEKLIKLSDGTPVWESEMGKYAAIIARLNLTIIGDRDSIRKTVHWQKQTQSEILDERDLPGKWIPVVPVYWTRVVIDGKRQVWGLVKDAMDPARMNNFWQTAITESLALAPKAKWLIPEGADEGHELEFKNSNISTSASIHFKTTDVNGQPIPFAPQRIQPEPPPAGLIEATFMASNNLSRVMGIFDPGVRGGAQHKSDKTLNAEQGQSEVTNYDGYDNLTRSIKHSWRIMLSWVPYVMDVKTMRRIVGDDGRENLVTLNEKKQDGAIEKVLNDVRVGTYDVVMETGPGYDTKRQEGVANTMQLLDTPIGEKIAQTSDDLIVRQMDFQGADAIADRLAAANPLAQIDDKSDVPPKVQMIVKAQQQKIQELQQQLQAAGVELKFGLKKEEIKQEAENKRSFMDNTVKAHDINERNLSMQHSTETKALAGQNEEEIKGIVQLLIHHLDTARLEKENERQDAELKAKSNENASEAA